VNVVHVNNVYVPLRRRLPAALVLAALTPLIAEMLLGSTPLDRAYVLVLELPMYGGGALLIRELSIRLRAGWPAILLFGAAYGIFEEGLVTQSIFDPSYSGAHLLDYGAGVPWVISVLIGHAVWSLGVPIALTEQIFADRREERWLRTPGLVIATTLLVLGSFVLGFGTRTLTTFHASTSQTVGAIATIIVLVGTAVLVGRRRRAAKTNNPVPAWRLVGGLAFVAGSAHMLAFYSYARWHLALPVVVPVLLDLGAAVATGILVARWSRSQNWGQPHVLALVGGALATYFWAGLIFVTTPPVDPANIAGQAALILAGTTLLAVLATRRSAEVGAPSLR
jgi:hypothetical protein